MKLDKNTYIIFLLKLVISAIIAVVVLYNIDADKTRSVIGNADLSFIIFAVALLPLNLYLQFLKWKYLVNKTAETAVPSRQIWISVFLGISFGFITPGRVGELGKLLVIRNVDKLKLLSMGIIEKIYDTFPVVIFGIISVSFLPHLIFTDSMFMRANLIIFSLIISAFTYFVAVHPGLFRMILNYLKNNIIKNNARFSRFCDGLHGFKKNNAKVLFLLSGSLFLVYTVQFVLLIMAFGDIDIFHAFTGVWAAILLKTFLPFSLGDIGIREGTAVYIFSLFNFPAEAAVSAAFSLFLINILLPSTVGLVLLPFVKFVNRLLNNK